MHAGPRGVTPQSRVQQKIACKGKVLVDRGFESSPRVLWDVRDVDGCAHDSDVPSTTRRTVHHRQHCNDFVSALDRREADAMPCHVPFPHMAADVPQGKRARDAPAREPSAIMARTGRCSVNDCRRKRQSWLPGGAE
jgi:hypothetical protein